MTKMKTKSGAMAILFGLTYMVSYITRTNYGAIITEMQSATGYSKSLLSMALTCSFITYGAGQLISGMMGDKISPKRLVTYGLVATVLMNLLIPLCNNPFLMAAIWGVNGFAQSFMWPPIVKIMSGIMTDEEYNRSVGTVSYGSSVGTICIYLFSPIIIAASGWKSVFVFSALVGILMIFVWNKFASDVAVEPRKKERTTERKNIFFTPVMLGIMAAIILHGTIRDGVTTWMPSYIAETYHLSNEISILTGVILPVFGIICFALSTKLHTTVLKNPIFCAAFFFGLGTAAALGLELFTGQNAALSVLMSALLTGCMHGANLMLIGIVPNYFKDTGRVSTVSGLLNFFTYVGSAASSYGIALLSETAGWSITILVWAAIALCATLICTTVGIFWKDK